MEKTVRAILCGTGGYGKNHLDWIFDPENRDVSLAGVMDPMITPELRADFEARGIPVHTDLKECLAQIRPDAVYIASPIAVHAEQTCLALEHGCHVLCEKPMCGSVPEAEQMRAARDAAQKQVAIGYQLSFSRGIQAFKADILKGDFGTPGHAKTLVAHCRPWFYYRRNGWAGRVRDDAGRWVLDSPVNNAHAHFLHNMFYLLGSAPDRSAVPVSVTGETYRAYPVENCDTVCLRCSTDSGADVLFFTSHATEETLRLQSVFEFSEARAVYSHPSERIDITFRSGETRRYIAAAKDGRNRKMESIIEASRTGKAPACGIEAAYSQTLCVNGLYDSAGPGTPLPEGEISRSDERIFMRGLGAVLTDCFERGTLPSEAGLSWARPGREIDLKGGVSPVFRSQKP